MVIFHCHVILPEGTLPETNIAPKNGWLEYYFPIGEAYFQVLFFRESLPQCHSTLNRTQPSTSTHLALVEG